MNKRLQALLQRKSAAVGKMKDISAAAGENPFTAEQQTQFDALRAEVEQLNGSIASEQQIIEAQRSLGAVEIADPATLQTLGHRSQASATHEFASFGEYMRAVRNAASGSVDQRLHVGAAATTYGSEGTLADGGFQVPPSYSRDVWKHSLEEDAFLPLTDGMPIEGNSMSYPKDETTPWGTDGIRAYWEAEAAQATQTKPKGAVNTLRLNKLMALIPVTDELQADTTALGAYIDAKASDSIRWKTNLSLFSGTGAGQPEGVFTAACRVDVAKETSQTADTVVAANVAKMYARQIKPTRAVWLVNPMVMPQIMLMTIGDQPIWTPPVSGMTQAPMGMLLGRPIYITQVAKVVGDVGDIGFVDFKHLRSITKQGGIESATSMHFFFDQGMNAYRLTFRVDAKPVIASAVSPANGSDTLSPFVFLADRA